jgi:hypothetical protein
MRNSKFFILLSVVVAMGVAAFYLERNDDKKEAAKYRRLSVQADQISSVFIERKVGDKIESLDLAKTSDGWVFRNDIMLADSEYMKDMTQAIESAEFEEVILSPDQTLDQFHFDKPAVHIKILDNLNRLNILIMSDRRNFAGQPYFKLNQEKKIYTLNTDLDKKILNKIIFFQDKHVFKTQREEFKKIKVNSLNHQFDIVTIPHLDKSQVTAFIDKIKNLTVQEYVALEVKCDFKSPVVSVMMSADTLNWSLKLLLDHKDKKLYAEAEIADQGKSKKYCVEYDTSYWAYFSNLSEQQFVKDQK